MDRVGGYLGYLALCEDARAYDELMCVMAAEADYARAKEREAKLTAAHGGG